MYYLLFRNRWFAAIWALGILGTAYGVAMRETSRPGMAEADAHASEAAYAQWAREDVRPVESAVEEDSVETTEQEETVD
jgi:hypothetical protein